MRMDYSCTEGKFIFPTVWKTPCDNRSSRCTTICHLPDTVTNFIWTIAPGVLNRFQQSKWPQKALKKTFQTVPKMSQSDQYSPSYQQISQ